MSGVNRKEQFVTIEMPNRVRSAKPMKKGTMMFMTPQLKNEKRVSARRYSPQHKDTEYRLVYKKHHN